MVRDLRLNLPAHAVPAECTSSFGWHLACTARSEARTYIWRYVGPIFRSAGTPGLKSGPTFWRYVGPVFRPASEPALGDVEALGIVKHIVKETAERILPHR